LPVEVRQLRITPASAAAASSGSNRPKPTRGGTDSYTRGPGLNLGGGRRPVVVNANGNEDERDKSPYDVVIELHGIIYIFNPPDMTKLATVAVPGAPYAAGAPDAAGVPEIPAAEGAAPKAAPAEEKEAAGDEGAEDADQPKKEKVKAGPVEAADDAAPPAEAEAPDAKAEE
jgi:hypothetical protein